MANSSQSQDPDPDIVREHTWKFENPISIHGEIDPEAPPQSPQTLETSNFQDPEESQVLEQEDQESSGMLRQSFNPTSKKVNKRKQKSFKKLQAVNKKVQSMFNTIVLVPFEPLKTLDFSKHEGLLKRLGLWDFACIEFDSSIRADLICQFIVSTDFSKRCCFVNGIRINIGRAHFARAFKLPLQTKKDKSVGNAAGVAIDLDLVWEKVSDKDVLFVEEFVRNWVILHGDGCIMSNEITNWIGFIRDGHPEKLDWATLFWSMVEAELKQRDQLQTCFYASHLQYFLKSQRREFFAEEAKEVLLGDEEMKEDGKLLMEGDKQLEPVEVNKEDLLNEAIKVDEKETEKDEKKVEKDEKEGPHSDDAEVEEMKDCSYYESVKGEDNVLSEECCIELTLGNQDIVEKEKTRDDDKCKEKKQDYWFLSGNDNSSKHFLQRCNLGENKGFNGNEEIGHEVEHVEIKEEVEVEDEGDQMEENELEVGEIGEEVEVDDSWEEVEIDDSEEEVEEEVDETDEHVEVEEEEEEEEEEDEIECNIPPNYRPFDEADLTGDFLQGIETAQMPSNLQGQQLHENSSMEKFASNAETHLVTGGPSMFGNGHKRVIDYVQDAAQLDGNKRIRTDVGWDQKTSDFGFCMGQMEQFMERAKAIHKEKEQDFHDLNMTNQYLLHELQQRDNIVETLQRTKSEELQKKDREIFRLERELCLLGELVNGYREALKENRRVFSEYRQRFQLPEEPIYKDAGPGGLVLSVTELEKQRQKKETEDMLNRLVIEQKYAEALECYVNQFEELFAKVQKIDFDRLTPIENEVKLLKELYAAKRRTSENGGSKTAG